MQLMPLTQLIDAIRQTNSNSHFGAKALRGKEEDTLSGPSISQLSAPKSKRFGLNLRIGSRLMQRQENVCQNVELGNPARFDLSA
jgi:hypothetical protein